MAKKHSFSFSNATPEEAEFIDYQLSFSTADILDSLFYGDISLLESVHEWPKIQPGTYYFLEGELRPLVEGPPPGSVPFS